MAGGNLWSQDELSSLRALYADPAISKTDLLSALPGRSLRSIYMKAWELGIGRQWSDAEIERLRRLFVDPSIEDADLVAAFPGRGATAIVQQAGNLGLRRPRSKPSNRWTDDQIDELTKSFPDSSIERDRICGSLNRSWDAIRKMAEKLGLQRIEAESREAIAMRHRRAVAAGVASSRVDKRPWTTDEIRILEERYPDFRVDQDEICDVLGRTWVSVKSKASSLGLNRPRKKYHVRSDYFDVVDTDEKAYWLGFIAADGAVSGLRAFKIDLASKDANHLLSFRDIIAPDVELQPIEPKTIKHLTTSYTSSSGVSLQLSDRSLVHSLLRYGIVQGKSRCFLWPTILDEAFAKAFFVGYFDGDGSLCKENETGRLHFSLLGTHPFLMAVHERLQRWASIEIPLPRQSGGPSLFRLSKTGESVRSIAAVLDEIEHGLLRKRILAIDHC